MYCWVDASLVAEWNKTVLIKWNSFSGCKEAMASGSSTAFGETGPSVCLSFGYMAETRMEFEIQSVCGSSGFCYVMLREEHHHGSRRVGLEMMHTHRQQTSVFNLGTSGSRD
jgi:hypothetical protein